MGRRIGDSDRRSRADRSQGVATGATEFVDRAVRLGNCLCICDVPRVPGSVERFAETPVHAVPVAMALMLEHDFRVAGHGRTEELVAAWHCMRCFGDVDRVCLASGTGAL